MEQKNINIEKLANKIALEWRKKTGQFNVLGSVNKEIGKLLPTILEVLAESEIDMASLKKKPSVKRRIQVTKMTKGIHKFLNDQELYDFVTVDFEGLKENIKKMYAHLPQETIDNMVDSCVPARDELDLIDGIQRIPDPDEIPLFSLFGGSKMVVTLPGKIRQNTRYGTFYVPVPVPPKLLPSKYRRNPDANIPDQTDI